MTPKEQKQVEVYLCAYKHFSEQYFSSLSTLYRVFPVLITLFAITGALLREEPRHIPFLVNFGILILFAWLGFVYICVNKFGNTALDLEYKINSITFDVKSEMLAYYRVTQCGGATAFTGYELYMPAIGSFFVAAHLISLYYVRDIMINGFQAQVWLANAVSIVSLLYFIIIAIIMVYLEVKCKANRKRLSLMYE